MKSISYEAPSTSRLAINHDLEKFPVKWQDRVPSRQTKTATAIQAIFEPKTLVVEANHTIADIERIFGIMGLGQSLLLGAKSLVGKTLVYHNGTIHIQESGTKFAVRSIVNQEQVIESEQKNVTTTLTNTSTRFGELMRKSSEYYNTPANDRQFALTA